MGSFYCIEPVTGVLQEPLELGISCFMKAMHIKPHKQYLNHDDRLGEPSVIAGQQILAVIDKSSRCGDDFDLEEYAPIRLNTHPFHPLNRASILHDEPCVL